MTQLTLVRCVDVEVQTVLALISGQNLLHVQQVIPSGSRHGLERLCLVGQLGRESLRASGTVPVGHASARPGLRIPRRAESVDADRWSGVGNAQKDLDRTQRAGHGENEALDESVAGLDARTGRRLSSRKRRSLDEQLDHHKCQQHGAAHVVLHHSVAGPPPGAMSSNEHVLVREAEHCRAPA